MKIKEWKCKPCGKEHDRREFIKKAGKGVIGGAAAAYLLGRGAPSLKATCENILQLTVSGGTIQTSIVAGAAQLVAGDAALDLWAINYQNNIYEWLGGANWQNNTAGICPYRVQLTAAGFAYCMNKNIVTSGAGFPIVVWNPATSSWSQVSGGYGHKVMPSDGGYHWALSAGSSFWRWQSSTQSWVNYNCPVSATLIQGSAVDGTAYCQGNGFVGGTGFGRIYTFSSTAAAWSLAGGSYPNVNACLAPVDHTLGYMVQGACVVWQFNPSTGNFTKISNQPPTSNEIVDARACKDGALWIYDSKGIPYRYYAGSWVSGPSNANLSGHLAANTNQSCYAISGLYCGPSSLDIQPMLNWYSVTSGGVLAWWYGAGGNSTPSADSVPTMWMTTHGPTIKTICSSGGTLPAYSTFKTMVQDYDTLINRLQHSGTSLDYNAFLKTYYPDFINLNVPPTASVVQFGNPSAVTDFANFMNGVYGIGAPTGHLQNGNGWLDIAKIPSFGTATVAQGLVDGQNVSIGTNSTTLENLFDNNTSYSGFVAAGGCTTTVPKCINDAVCLASCLHEICYGCGNEIGILDVNVGQFLMDLIAMLRSMAVAMTALYTSSGACNDSINWSNWGTL